MISKDKIREYEGSFNYSKQSRADGLRKFIRNCPANSSSILVSKKRFLKSGGCNESFISPDQVLFLRLFSVGPAVFLEQVVAKLPDNQALDRLSSQIKRSRYESILALINLCNENPDLEIAFVKQAYRRALSRANTYNRYLNNNFFSKYWFMYIFSKLLLPRFYKKLMHESLKVFSGKHSGRPLAWKTGADRISISSQFIKK